MRLGLNVSYVLSFVDTVSVTHRLILHTDLTSCTWGGGGSDK